MQTYILVTGPDNFLPQICDDYEISYCQCPKLDTFSFVGLGEHEYLVALFASTVK